MVAALLKVHHDVEQGDLISSTLRIQSLKVLGQNQLVVFPVVSNKDEVHCYSMCQSPSHISLSSQHSQRYKIYVC